MRTFFTAAEIQQQELAAKKKQDELWGLTKKSKKYYFGGIETKSTNYPVARFIGYDSGIASNRFPVWRTGEYVFCGMPGLPYGDAIVGRFESLTDREVLEYNPCARQIDKSVNTKNIKFEQPHALPK